MFTIDFFKQRIKINSLTGCWFYHSRFGVAREYGGATWNKKQYRAHRLFYELYIGEIPKGLYILHRCDNPFCVSPFHLFSGTQKENTQDCAAKGRSGRNRHGTKFRYFKGCRCEPCRHAYRIWIIRLHAHYEKYPEQNLDNK